MAHRLFTHALALGIAALLLCAGQAECMAKARPAMGMGGCCKHGHCKQSPGTAPHSTCETAPVSPEQAIVPATVAPVAIAALEPVAESLVALVSQPAGSTPFYSPPDLFVLNSAFLI